MIDFPALSEIVTSTPSKIIMLVADGLGGVPHPDTGCSELETANLPNLDSLARESASGRTVPLVHGVTPGSGASTGRCGSTTATAPWTISSDVRVSAIVTTAPGRAPPGAISAGGGGAPASPTGGGATGIVAITVPSSAHRAGGGATRPV